MAIFLDISGAFSNTATHSMVRSLANKGVEVQLVKWVEDMLSNRTATASLGNDTVRKRITTGAAEGGILSPPLFNNVVSEGVQAYTTRSQTQGKAFADDIILLRSGYDIWEIALNLQIAANSLSDWAKSNSLSFNADKTKVMIFTRKHKYEKPEIQINRKPIEYVETFKYLGVTFDRKLTWKEHIKTQVRKAKISLMMGRRMMGKTWGLNPKVTSWLYTAVIRPMFTYGSVVWINSLEVKENRDKLNRLQRLACRMITGSMRSTPTAGMEVMLNMTPIVETIKETAVATSIRLKKVGHWPDNEITFKSHTKSINEIKQEIPETQFPQDKSHIKAKIANNFEIQIRTREHFAMNHIRPMPLDPITVNCFTDGSKNETGSGAGYITKSYEYKSQQAIHLGEHATVFQAEITAISAASLSMLDAGITNKVIQFYIDSQSAIKALESYIVHNKSVGECKRLLNKLSKYGNGVILNWIPGHSNQRGNGIADNLAKWGENHPEPGLEPRIPASGCTIRGTIRSWGKSEQQRLWTERTDCRQSKLQGVFLILILFK